MPDYVLYFKSSGFERFINSLYDKYKSLGRFSGTIKINNLTDIEAKALSKLFGESYHENDDFKVSVKKFIELMNNSKYSDFDIGVLVSNILNVSLISNRERNVLLFDKEQNFFDEICIYDKYDWIKYVILNKVQPYNILHKRYLKNKSKLKKDLIDIITLLNNLPNHDILISIYAANYTKDPHFLDFDSYNFNLFLYGLCFIDGCCYLKNREDIIKLLAKYHIQIDYLSNFVITYNLISNNDYVSGFANNKESLILNLQNILKSDFDSKVKKVFIFENPSILYEIISNNIDVSVIISGGFPNSCVYLLLDKLIDNNNKLYYNGDFDPEGLLIASKLKNKYLDNIRLFCYDKIDYLSCISKNVISDKRISKLDKIDDNDLLVMKELIKNNKYSAYQENNKSRIIDFVKNNK